MVHAICIREKALYASSRECIAGRRRACCDVFKSLLLRYTDPRIAPGMVDNGQPTIRRTLSIRVAISATSTPARKKRATSSYSLRL